MKKNTTALEEASKRQKDFQEAQGKVIRHRQKYFVEAVIPGRAWLRAADGTEMTVTVGDVIEGYGRIVSINSYSGTVSTDSEINIYYGINTRKVKGRKDVDIDLRQIFYFDIEHAAEKCIFTVKFTK